MELRERHNLNSDTALHRHVPMVSHASAQLSTVFEATRVRAWEH